MDKIDYITAPALSYSTIKKISQNRLEEVKRDKYYEESEPLLIGTMVDQLLTQPEAYQYFICDTKPTDAIMNVIKLAFDFKIDNNIEKNRGMILGAAVSQGFYNNLKNEDTRIDKIISIGRDYWNCLLEAGERLIISTEQDEKARKVAALLRNHKFTKDIFKHPNISYQREMYFMHGDVPGKAKPDIYIPGHIYDIKILDGSVHDFFRSYKRLRWDLQAGWFSLGAEIITGGEHEFSFIVASPNSEYPIIYDVPPDVKEAAIDECDLASQRYTWYEQYGWEVPMDLVMNNGRITIEARNVHNVKYNGVAAEQAVQE